MSGMCFPRQFLMVLLSLSCLVVCEANHNDDNDDEFAFPDEDRPNVRSRENFARNDEAIFFPRDDSPPEIPCTTYDGARGACKLLVRCTTFFAEIAELSRSPCTISAEQQGVCCPPTKQATQDPSMVVSKPNIPIVFAELSSNEINHACEKGIWMQQQRITFEDDLVQNNVVAEEGTPVFMHARLFETNDRIVKKAKDASLTLSATQQLVNEFNLTKAQAEHALPNFSVENTIIAETCPPLSVCPVSKYRTYDGSCNNRLNQDWGKAGTAYERFIPPDYSDGVNSIRQSIFGGPLPSARSISSGIIQDRDSTYSNFTMLIMQWGQFLDHDITHTPISKGSNKADISCCTRGTRRPRNAMHPECLPIDIDPNDALYGRFSQKCMEFVRSMPAIRPQCKFGPREQMNQITAFIDASNVYGTNAEEIQKLRTFQGGQLKATPNGRHDLLPGDPKSAGCRAQSAQRMCFMAGDSRVNEQPNLAIMHTIWMRQHNLVADQLLQTNPLWRNNDEAVFQEARRIVIAQMQHITYNEYLPIVLGRKFMETYGLLPKDKGYSNTYRNNVNPSIHNAFTAAAFRYGHTLIGGNLEGYNMFGLETTKLPLSKNQFSPFTLYEPEKFDDLVRGLAKQRSQKFDHFFTEQIRDKLFAQGLPFGMDLIALNIQRGRDHGLPAYNEWRRLCQLPLARSWNDLADVMDGGVVQKLSQIYKGVDDVDLFIGGVSERPVAGSLLGPTFLCLVGDQFARLKLGDRLFYDNGHEAESRFSEPQLQELRKTTLARILCDNTDLRTMQPLAFVTAHFVNKRAVCDSDVLIPRPNFNRWTNEPIFS